MPRIIPIKDLKDTAKVSEMCHKSSDPIFCNKEWIWRYGADEYGGLRGDASEGAALP